MDELVFKIADAVKKCSKIMININEDLGIEQKEGIGNFVTRYDKEVENNLRKELLAIIPDAGFFGEEGEEKSKILENGYTFIVDPIDGTTNFARGLDMSTISVGLLKDAKPFIGVCYNPYRNEMFIAQKGKGSYMNGEKLHVSNKKLTEGLVYMGSAAYYEELKDKTIDMVSKLIRVANDFRRFGSASYELCLVAAGHVEALYEMRLQPWDIAAGVLMIEEAGGKVTTIDGGEIIYSEPTSIIASNNCDDYLGYLQ